MITIDADSTRLEVGDGTLTRRILKRCRDAGVKYETETSFVKIRRDKYGSRTDAYLVPSAIYEEELARRELELEARSQKDAAERMQRQNETRQRRMLEVSDRFPLLEAVSIEKLVDSQRSIHSESEVGYQFGVGTKNYWSQLGYTATGQPNGFLVRGRRLCNTYSSRQLQPKKSRMTVEQLQRKWLKKYGTPELVVAQAIRFANRLQKVKRISEFYPLKDRWIVANQDRLVEGRVARVESRHCWSCGGTGEYYGDDDCDRCGGTGIYSSKTLYEHEFLICGTRFHFHSYARPEVALAEGTGKNDKPFGRPFLSEEMPVPPQRTIIQLIQSMMPVLEEAS